MKSFFAFFAILPLVFLFSSCAKVPAPVFPLPEGYEAAVRLTLDGQTGDYTFRLTADGYELIGGGYRFACKNGVCTLVAGDLSLPLPAGMMPDRGLLFAALTIPAEAELLPMKAEGGDGGEGGGGGGGGEKTLWTYVGKTGNFLYETDETGAVTAVNGEGETEFRAEIVKR